MFQILSQAIFRRTVLNPSYKNRLFSSIFPKQALLKPVNIGNKGYGYRSYAVDRLTSNKTASSLMLLAGGAFIASCLYNISQQNRAKIPNQLMTNLKVAYAWLFGSLAFTYACACAFVPIAARTNPLMAFIPILAVSFLGAPVVRSMSYQDQTVMKTLGFASICAAIGFMLSYTVLFVPSAVITQASLCSGSLFTGLCVAGMTAPSGKFDNIASFCSIGILVIFAASIASIFAPAHITAFQNIFVYMGIPVMSGLTLYSSNELYREASKGVRYGNEFDPINCVIPLYFHLINLFNMFVTLFSKRDRK